MAKYTIHGGHGYPGKGACGVVGYINESIQARVVADKVKDLLQIAGNEVHNITVDTGSQNEILRELVSRANHVKADLNFSIHFNAANGKAKGTEVWIKEGDEKTKEIAERIAKSISHLSFTNRGVKSSSTYYILRNMTSPTLLVECCFADNKEDFSHYDADKMAKAIAEAIVGHNIVKPHIAHTEEIAGTLSPNGGIPVYRLINPRSGQHHFTRVIAESDILIDSGWVLEGVGWYIGNDESIPVFRLYNPNDGKHFFSLDRNEVAFLVNAGWDFEGIGWYSDPEERVPVYRMYSERTGQHHYTANTSEKMAMLGNGWFQEGIGWYATEGGR